MLIWLAQAATITTAPVTTTTPRRTPRSDTMRISARHIAMCLALIRMVSERGVRRGVVVVTGAVVIVAACANQINIAYGAYLTPRDALGMTRYDDIALRDTTADGRLLPDVDPVSS